MQAKPSDQPIAFMGPPVLIDHSATFALAEMPAIALYLGETLGLIPDTPQGRAMTVKIVNDANDLIDEMTLDGGREMWSAATWADFLPRLTHWMAIWEDTGRRSGLGKKDGFLLGTPQPGVADIVTSTLWTTMGDRFPALARLLEETAPNTAALSQRLQALPALAALRDDTRKRYGDAWCGGQIEQSLRQVAV